MKARVEAPVDLADNRMAIPPWDRDRIGESGGCRRGGSRRGGGHRRKARGSGRL